MKSSPSELRSATIIPARGGSKGIPRKNLVKVAGKPLISYAISASQHSSVDETWVSSEDPEILNVAQDLGARTLRRPAELATDHSSSEDVLIHFAENVAFDRLIFLQATCPFTTSGDIDTSLEMLAEYDSVLSVTRLTQFVWTGEQPNYDLLARKRRQDCELVYLETGALFATTRENLIRNRNRLGGRIGYCVVPKLRSFDIDSYDDLELVRKIMECGLKTL